MSVAPRACYVRRAMPGDTWLLLPTVAQSDIDELAALGVTPEMCMRGGMEHSRNVFTAFFYGRPGMMFGCVEHATHGVPWSVVTTAVQTFPIPFLRLTKRFMESLDMHLENYVDARNLRTIAWLKWLGFTIDEPVPAGIDGEMFHRFWRAAKGAPCVGG